MRVSKTAFCFKSQGFENALKASKGGWCCLDSSCALVCTHPAVCFSANLSTVKKVFCVPILLGHQLWSIRKT